MLLQKLILWIIRFFKIPVEGLTPTTPVTNTVEKPVEKVVAKPAPPPPPASPPTKEPEKRYRQTRLPEDMLTQHVSKKEVVHSTTAARKGIDNTPSANQWYNALAVASEVYEPLRNHFGIPIRITSFFRCEELNKAIGGSRKSQHCQAQAMDISVTGRRYLVDWEGTQQVVNNRMLFEWIRDNLEFDQLISEFPNRDGVPRWVHVSYKLDGQNRKTVLKAYSNNGKTEYKNLT